MAWDLGQAKEDPSRWCGDGHGSWRDLRAWTLTSSCWGQPQDTLSLRVLRECCDPPDQSRLNIAAQEGAAALDSGAGSGLPCVEPQALRKAYQYAVRRPGSPGVQGNKLINLNIVIIIKLQLIIYYS